MTNNGIDLLFDDSPLARDPVLARHRVSVPVFRVPDAAALPDDVRTLACRNWEDRTRAEYIGVMVARRFHGLLVDLNAPNDVQELALAMALHEQRHTTLCLAAARSLGSEGELSFDIEELQQPRSEAGPMTDCFEMVAATFALGEVTALGLLRETLRRVPQSVPLGYGEVLRRIARDEVLHARIGPALLAASRRGELDEWLPWPGDTTVRALVSAHVTALASRDVVEPADALAAETPEVARGLALVGIPEPAAFKAAYHRALSVDVAATWRRFGLADLLS